MPVLALRRATAAGPPPSRLSPERTALAEAIVAHREAQATHTALLAACDYDGPAHAAITAASEALERAQSALTTAQENAASALVNASLGASTAPAMTVRQARQAIEAAEDDLAASIAAGTILRERIAPAQQSIEATQWRVDRCALAVIRAETPIAELLSELDALQRQMADRARLLQWLTFNCNIPVFGPDAMPGASEISTRFQSIPSSWMVSNCNEKSPSTMAWIAALAALKQDATAPLPTI